MTPFTAVSATAAPLDEANIDTNQICPSRFNKIPRGPKYAQILFHDLRFHPDGSEKDFILNREPYRHAQIIVADRGFGCGSSRETAVYTLAEFGIRCIIAPSFADIHAGNLCKNGLLPVVLPEQIAADIRMQLHEHPGANIAVDLNAQNVTDTRGNVHHFEINATRKKCLLEGLDDIARTKLRIDVMNEFEQAYQARIPWAFRFHD